eukprot:s266_g3.t2
MHILEVPQVRTPTIGLPDDLRSWSKRLGQKDQTLERVRDLLRDVQVSRLQLNIIVANAGVGALARQTAWRETLEKLTEIRCRSLELNQISFGSSLVAFGESKTIGSKWPAAKQLLIDMEKIWNVVPNIICWNSCISSMQSWFRAEHLLHRIPSMGCMPDCISYNAAAATSPWRRSILQLIKMRGARVRPNVVTYNTLLHACQGSHAQVARTLLNCMDDDRLEPDVITLNSAIGASHDDWPAGLQYLRELQGQTAMSAGNALKALASSVQWRHGLRILAFLQSRSTVNAVAAATAFQLAANAPQAELVHGLLEDMQAWRLQISLRCGNAVLRALKTWPEALHRLAGQSSQSLAPNEVSHNTVCAHMADAACWLQVLQLFTQQRHLSLQVDVMGCGSSITAFATCLVPLWRDALAMMSFMGCSLISAEVTNHNSLISALRMDRQWRRAVLPELPDAVTTGAILSAHLQDSDWPRAIGTLSWAGGCRLDVDAAGLEAAAISCGREGWWRTALALKSTALQGLPWERALVLSPVTLETAMASMQACVSEDAWQRALAMCSRIPCDNDVPLLTMKLQAFQVGFQSFWASSTLAQLHGAGFRHVQSLR